MKITTGQDIVDKLNAAMETMTREELVKLVKEAVSRADELENASKMLSTHLKVLCHKNGGTLFYTKDEFETAAKDDQVFETEYGLKDKKEACILKLVSRGKKQ